LLARLRASGKVGARFLLTCRGWQGACRPTTYGLGATSKAVVANVKGGTLGTGTLHLDRYATCTCSSQPVAGERVSTLDRVAFQLFQLPPGGGPVCCTLFYGGRCK